MVKPSTKAIVVSGSAGGGAVGQFIAVKQLMDKKLSQKPLGSFHTSVAKGLNEWTTIASIIGAGASLSYIWYEQEYKGKPLTDVGLAVGTYGITSAIAAVVNAFLDPMGGDNAPIVNLGSIKKAFKSAGKEVSKDIGGLEQKAGKFVR